MQRSESEEAGGYRESSQALSRLCGVLLNGCRTERIGRRILLALGAVLPHVAV